MYVSSLHTSRLNRFEDMIIVTEKGAEVIDHMPREQISPPNYGF